MIGQVYEFAAFQLDADRLELRKDGEPVRLERKPLEVLLLLVRNNGRLVTRSEIASELWGDEVFVDTEHGINTAVRKVRAALADDPEAPCFLRTVTRKGYCFLAPVTLAVAASTLGEELAHEYLSITSPRKPLIARTWTAPLASLLALTLMAIAATVALWLHDRNTPPQIRYEQLTDLSAAAAAPALSPDGRSVAFLRGPDFFSTGPIFLKMLPNGGMRQITDDDRVKYGPAFSPDGSEITYSASILKA